MSACDLGNGLRVIDLTKQLDPGTESHAIFCIFADCLIDTSEKTLKNEIKWQ